MGTDIRVDDIAVAVWLPATIQVIIVVVFVEEYGAAQLLLLVLLPRFRGRIFGRAAA
jgi:hypothetical protein